MNENGTLILHANPQLTYTSDESDFCGQANLSACSMAVTTVPFDGVPHVFHVLAAFPVEAQPRLKAASWGVAYDPDRVILTAHGPCDPGSFLIPDSAWPASGTGVGMSWGEPRAGTLNDLYWFAGYGYQQGVESPDTASVSLVPHPVQGGVMVDDSEPPEEDTIVAFGRLGFGVAGYAPCPDAGGDQAGGEPETPEDGEADIPEAALVFGDLTFVELHAGSDSSFVADYRGLKRDHHLRVLLAVAPDGLICRTDAEQRDALVEDGRVKLVTHEVIPGLPPLDAGDILPGDPGFAARSWNELISTEAPADSGLKLMEGFPGCLDEEGRTGPEENPERQTSIYMMGEVGVSLLFMESLQSGPCLEPNGPEDWTPTERNWAFVKVEDGLQDLADLSPDANLTFAIMEAPVLWTSVEPIQLASSNTTWKSEAMDQMGMPPGQWKDRTFALNNLRRSDPVDPFDWWFTVFVIRDVCDEDHRFADGMVSHGSHHGPSVTLLFANGYTFPSTWLGHIIAHETCHIFGAGDEYPSGCSCADPYGYLHVENGNCTNCPGPQVLCLMNDAHDFVLCPFTRGQIGWRDSDDPPDQIFDPIDHPYSTVSMRLGTDESIGLGDWVDIYSGGTWVKRLAATGWTWDRGEMLWDGIKYDGNPATNGTYTWRLRGGTPHEATLATDSAVPTISNLEIVSGFGLQNTLQFNFADADTRSGRVRAVATMPGVPNNRVVGDKYYRDTAGLGRPIAVPFEAVHDGMYMMSLRVWDVGGGQYATDAIPFWTGSPASAGGNRVLVPELALSRGRPSPGGSWLAWELRRSTAGTVDLQVVSVTGRCVRSWPARSIFAGSTRVLWDGLDDRGVRVPGGRYFLVVTDDSGNTTTAAVTVVR